MKERLKSMLAQAGGTRTAAATEQTAGAAPSSGMDTLLATVHRLAPSENSFGVPVIDCREFATSLLADTAEPIPPEMAILPRDQRASLPDGATRLACSLSYPLDAYPPQGLLFMARSMQDKWHIFHYDKHLVFTRSWTGDPLFVAELDQRGPVLMVQAIQVAPGAIAEGPELAVAMVDFLIKSHLFRVAVPHPLPEDLPDNPALVATWSYNHFGRWGHFASWSDVIRLQLLSLDRRLVLRWTE